MDGSWDSDLKNEGPLMSLWIDRLLDSDGALIGSEACPEGHALSPVSSSLSLLPGCHEAGHLFPPLLTISF